MKAKYRPPRHGDQVQYKPAVGRDTNSGPLVATKEYLTALQQNLLGLASHLEQSIRMKTSSERTAHWFRCVYLLPPSHSITTVIISLSPCTERSVSVNQGRRTSRKLLATSLAPVIPWKPATATLRTHYSLTAFRASQTTLEQPWCVCVPVRAVLLCSLSRIVSLCCTATHTQCIGTSFEAVVVMVPHTTPHHPTSHPHSHTELRPRPAS